MRRPPPRFSLVVVATALVVIAPLAGCATTYDEALVADTAPATTTTLPTGTTAEILERLRTQSVALSGVMIDGGDTTEAYDSLADLWAAARPDVQAARPDLIDGFDRSLAMSKKAVDYKRAADADKAARNIDALVSAYTD
ncbi:MAG: hypothetical protein WD023_09335 [Ilumatobacteraceae bacterium]